MYSFIPIRICHLNDGNNDYRLSYCTNKGLIYAIGQIGKYRGVQKPRRSSYKIGLDYLATNLEINGEPVSKNEIKCIIRPNRKKKHALKLPDRTVEIIEAIVALVDFPIDSMAHKNCREMAELYAKSRKAEILFCYRHLIGELIPQLNCVLGNLVPNSEAHRIAMALTNNGHICK